MAVEIIWTQTKKDKVLSLIQTFILKNESTCGEQVQQSDEAQIDSIDIMANIADILGATDIEDRDNSHKNFDYE